MDCEPNNSRRVEGPSVITIAIRTAPVIVGCWFIYCATRFEYSGSCSLNWVVELLTPAVSVSGGWLSRLALAVPSL